MTAYKSKNWPKKLRAALQGRTLFEVEKEVGWSANYLASAITEKRNISVGRAVTLAKALGVSSDWLFDDEDTRTLEQVLASNAVSELANLSKFAEIIQRAAREIAELETGTNTPEDLDLRQAREAVEAGLAAERQENFAKRPETDRTSGKAG